MTLRGPSFIRRFSPLGISLVLNGLFALALLRLFTISSLGETRIAVELTPLAVEKQVSTALPPPPPQIVKATEQAEKIVARENELIRPESPQPIESIEETIPESPVAKEEPHETMVQPTVISPAEVVSEQEIPQLVAISHPEETAGGGAGNTVEGTGGQAAPAATQVGDGGRGNTGSNAGSGPGESVAPGHGTGGETGAQPGGSTGGDSSETTVNITGTGTGTGKGDGNGPGSGESGVPKGESRKGYASSKPQPAYPSDARDEGIQGTVKLQVSIDARGKVTGEPKIIKRSGCRSLDKAAVTGVKKWTFEPALEDGKPVASTLTVEVKFELR